jgi:hypothetical protein
MGASYAPPLANLFMSEWESRSIDHMLGSGKLLYYSRYIDDIFGVWRGDLCELLQFITNVQTPNISLTLNTSLFSMQFLDVEVYKFSIPYAKNEFCLLTKPFVKPTKTAGLIHNHSCHPKSTKVATIKGEILRLFRFSQRKPDFDQHCEALFFGTKKSMLCKTYAALFESKCS